MQARASRTLLSFMRRPALPLLLLLLLPHGARAAVELNCQIFDETMVCDNERARLQKAEIRTCSG